MRQLTFVIISDPAKKMHGFNMPIKTFKRLIAVLTCCFLLAGVGFFNYIMHTRITAAEKAELLTLRDVNEELKIADRQKQAHIEELAQNLGVLQKDLEEVKHLDNEVRKLLASGENQITIAGKEQDIPLSRGGFGGPVVSPGPREVESLINDLNVQTKNQHKSLTDLKKAVANKKAIERATPSIQPAIGTFTAGFGWRSYPAGWHPGIDIANNIGTPVVATADGVVTESTYMSGYGYMIIINHGYGMETVYAHNNRNLVSIGQAVKKGETIAQMGNTGFSTGPHVHYEVRLNGTAVNPSKFM
jgi:murein DD-endopeptidase MepM/ murein hydrolase activator NlpD